MAVKLLYLSSKTVLYLLVFSHMACISSAYKLTKRRLHKVIATSSVFSSHFTGFALYDLSKQQMVYTRQADKYFIPASNTKLFTLYTSLQLLGDSIPALQYTIKNDSLIF